MPDLLAHALIAYTLCVLLSWRYEWLTTQYVTIGMAGAFVPDLAKIDLLLPDDSVELALDVPFDWFALHTAGSVLLSVLIGTLFVTSEERKRVFGLLAIGAVSHLLADALLLTTTGRSYPILWPLTRYRPPTPGLYLSTEPWPMLVALAAAIGVTLATRYYRSE